MQITTNGPSLAYNVLALSSGQPKLGKHSLLPNDFQPSRYQELLDDKTHRCAELFAPFTDLPPAVHPSPKEAFRMRAEFRIWHEGDDLFYAMFDKDNPKQPLRVNDYPFGSTTIQVLMPALRAALLKTPLLRERLFQVEFLTSTTNQALITLIYHKALTDEWETTARKLAQILGCLVIGRSRKQKVVLDASSIEETLNINGTDYHYKYYEQGFTQPNVVINCKMIEWVSSHISDPDRDLLELYCGLGNFTLPLSRQFRRVLATEVAKSSVHAAQENMALNKVENISIARLNAAETAQALCGERVFKRIATLPHALNDYDFSTILVDPPRAGLDPDSLNLARSMDTIAYISCNPETLARDLEQLTRTHTVDAWAVFDQFPYTHHTECGFILSKRP